MSKSTGTDASEHRLIQRVGRFMEPLCDYVREPEKTFDEWLSHVFTEFFYSKTGAAFAPFNDRFEGRRDFPEAFSRFVDDEVRGQRVGKFTALSRVTSALASRLSESLRDVGPFDTGPNERDARDYIADFPILLFQALRLVDTEEACKWAANAVRSKGGLAERWTLSDLPFPIALYHEMRGHDMSGPNRRDFSDALLEWCDEKKDLQAVAFPSFSILLDVLRSRNANARVELLDLRMELINALYKEIVELDHLKGSDAGLESRAKKLRQAFGVDGAACVESMATESKANWRRQPLLSAAFPKELAETPDRGKGESFDSVLLAKFIESSSLMYDDADLAA